MKQRFFAAFRSAARALSAFERPLSRIPGVVALYQALYRRVKPTGIVKLRVGETILWVDAADEGVARPILLRGVFEAEETELLQRILRPGMRVVDAGANIGYHSVLASRLVGPAGRVLAFEPEPSNFALLERNLAENACTNAQAFRLALSDATGRVALHTDRSNLGNPSLVAANVPELAGAVEVEAMTLDDFLAARAVGPIDLLKMDVQGAEGRVLAGARALIRQPGLRVLMELWPKGLENAGTDPAAMLGELAASGFSMVVVGGGSSGRALGMHELLEEVAQSRDGFLNVLLERRSSR